MHIAPQELAKFGLETYEIVKGACTDDFDKLEERLEDFHHLQETTDMEVGTSHGKTVSHTSTRPLKRTQTAKLDKTKGSDFAYTISAARRTEKRRLQNYLRMSDYIICDTLYTVLLESVKVRTGWHRYLYATCF